MGTLGEKPMKQTVLTAGLFMAGLAGLLTAQLARSEGQTTASASAASEGPVLINTCLISNDVQRLAAFYQKVLKIAPRFSGHSYVEFKTDAGVLAIFDARAQERYIPGSAEPSANRSSILEFRVTDVDGEYARLQGIVKTWVKPPTTQPWGTRSIYFRDPDGNLVNFFAPAKAK
jgi:uncharacterized glyoxalase superfamily protein PhnB